MDMYCYDDYYYYILLIFPVAHDRFSGGQIVSSRGFTSFLLHVLSKWICLYRHVYIRHIQYAPCMVYLPTKLCDFWGKFQHHGSHMGDIVLIQCILLQSRYNNMIV